MKTTLTEIKTYITNLEHKAGIKLNYSSCSPALQKKFRVDEKELLVLLTETIDTYRQADWEEVTLRDKYGEFQVSIINSTEVILRHGKTETLKLSALKKLVKSGFFSGN